MSWLRYKFPDGSYPPLEKIRLSSERLPENDNDKPSKALSSHCKPWVDAKTLGAVLKFPFRAKLTVTGCQEGKVKFGLEKTGSQYGMGSIVSNFSPGHFGIATNCKLRTDPGINVLVSNLSKEYNPPSSVIEGIIETWWYPKSIFIVFKNPLEGETINFEYGTPLCKLLPIAQVLNSFREMNAYEAAQFSKDESEYEVYRRENPELQWISESGHSFSRSYKKYMK